MGADNTKLRVSVVITCHNYGKYLETAVVSVLEQTHKPFEVIVVDDSSTDDTKSVTGSFSKQGVKYLRTGARCVHKARHIGFEHISGDIVLFVDADNYLPKAYIETGLREFTNRHVGVVYSGLREFGTQSNINNAQATGYDGEFSRELLIRDNFVDCCALIRREALEVSDAFDVYPDQIKTPADYVMFQRIAQGGWDFRKQSEKLNYRVHTDQNSQSARPVRVGLGPLFSHGLRFHTVTLFIPMSGRFYAWNEQKKFLERQGWPHDQIRLILCDTGKNNAFTLAVKKWISTCDYPDVHHFTFDAGRRGIADENRSDWKIESSVQVSMCRIYNKCREFLTTDFCWILEDDVIPPDDVLARLLSSFRPSVAVVSAAYPSRYDTNYVVWRKDRYPGNPWWPSFRMPKPDKTQQQVLPMRGAGFGCSVFRSEVLHKHIFVMPRGGLYYDGYFYRKLGEQWVRLIDWSCDCQHLGPRYRNGVELSEKTSAPGIVWQTDEDWAQLTARNDIELTGTIDGLQITACALDPQLYVSVNLPPGRYRFSIVAKFDGDLQGQLFWTSDRAFTSKAMRLFNMAGTGREKRYSIEFESADAIAAIRWDPHISTCSLKVVEISLFPVTQGQVI